MQGQGWYCHGDILLLAYQSYGDTISTSKVIGKVILPSHMARILRFITLSWITLENKD